MAMLNDEIEILKSLMIQLNDETAVLVTKQYHVECNDHSKIDRSKSMYRWMARVFKIEDLKSKIKWMMDDANRNVKFKWPNDKWPWYVKAKYPENYYVAEWLACKLKKMKSWDDGQKFLAGYQTKTKKRAAQFNKNAAYAIDGYLDEAGNTISLSDKNALLACVGQNLMKTSKSV